MRLFSSIFSLILVTGCISKKPQGSFDTTKTPPIPNYAQLENWAAHPYKKDQSDLLPSSSMTLADKETQIDVFFLHPTTLTGRLKGAKAWNGDVADAQLNEFTDDRTIKMQGSIFNGAGRVFAPRYRQAHLHSFYTKKRKKEGDMALELAYQDVKAAFLYYLQHENQGRGIIIASHSQGALHGKRLLKEFFDGKALQNHLVAAYLIGWPVEKNYFENIEICTSADQIACFCSWRTWKQKFGLRKAKQPEIAVTNPLSWNTEEGIFIPRTENKGAVLMNFNRIEAHTTDAQIYKGYLLSKRPKFKGSFFMRTRNYHIGDLNLFYVNVRENAELRAKVYLEQK